MAGVLTTTTQLPPEYQNYFNRRLLRVANPHIVYGSVAQKSVIPLHSGGGALFRRYERLDSDASLAPLTEGNSPTGSQLSKTDLTFPIQQHGDFVTLSDLAQMTLMSSPLRQANDRLGRQGAETVEKLLRDVASAGTNVFYAAGVAGRSSLQNSGHVIAETDLQKVIRQLEAGDADYFTEMISATEKVSTTPIPPAYFMIVHPDVAYTLRGFLTPVEKYSNVRATHMAEIGAYRQLRFLMSTLAKKLAGAGGAATGVKATGGNADVYLNIAFATDAVGVIPLGSKSMENIIHPIGSAGTADALNQRATSGWKYTGTRGALNEAFYVRLETTAIA
jgi:N4-gp56 family major capsid protein